MIHMAGEPRGKTPPATYQDSIDRFFDVHRERESFWSPPVGPRCGRASKLYLLIAVGGAVAFALFGPTELKCVESRLARVLIVLTGFIVSAGPPLFYWAEARGFERWVNATIPKDAQQGHREQYKMNAEHAKAFWASILAVYGALLLAW